MDTLDCILTNKPAPKTTHRIVVLTGAGISAESGIPTFRASDGLWENEPVEKVATPEGFARDPKRVHDFYNKRRQHLLSEKVQPNAAHRALASVQRWIEQQEGWEWLLVTQNIDDLHERGGSTDVVHMHGELLRIHCSDTQVSYQCRHDVSVNDACSCCELAGRLRPSVVWFNEMPLHMDRIHQRLRQATIFVAIGTSGHVYPAAGFFKEAQFSGAHTVELNLDPSSNAAEFDENHCGKATDIVPQYFASLIAST